jgi:hypothetical protein
MSYNTWKIVRGFIYILLILLLVLFGSCSKEVQQQEAVTYWIDVYDDNWKLKETFVSIHWHRSQMTQDEFDRYQAAYDDRIRRNSRGDWVCPPEKRFSRIEIHFDNCQ